MIWKICSIILILVLLSGCTTSLIESDDRVSIYLVGTPKVAFGGFSIKLRFKSPENYPHLIQNIKFNGTLYTGTEAFSSKGYFWEVDHHFSSSITDRTIEIMPGEVTEVDACLDGFSMLPDNWPPGFNYSFRSHPHDIQGHVTRRFPQAARIYQLKYDGYKLEFTSEGKYYVWYTSEN